MTSFQWNFPYASQRMPVFAGNVVATSHPLAVQAGLRILIKGGNAVDAALAAAITLTVLEPVSNGLGSDCFALIRDSEGLYGFNGSGRSPGAWTPERFAGLAEMPLIGWDTVTVPGAVNAWAAISERFGRLDFHDLFVPAVEYARYGFPVSPIIAAAWAKAPEIYGHMPEFAKTFLPKGRAPFPGEWFANPALANTLERISETGDESFYRGGIARKIVACSAESGGAMTFEDMAAHQGEWVTPVAMAYHGVEVHEIPPNGQGLAVLIALGILQFHDLREFPADSADSFHLQIEAMKLAFEAAHAHISDPLFMELDYHDLLTDDFLAEKAGRIRLDRAAPAVPQPPADHGTVYLAAADESGIMVSLIQSNYTGFGSGIVIPDTGISLHNRGRGFGMQPGHPNCVGGGKRPYHTIIPGFVTRNGRPFMSFGVMGAHMQPQGHVQMVVRIVDYHQNPQAASDAPRWHVCEDGTLALEKGFAPEIAEELRRRGHRILKGDPVWGHGGAQIVCCLENGYCAASDHRKDGQAGGF